MNLKQKIKTILRILRGEEFVPLVEGTVVNDKTTVIVNFLGNVITERVIRDFYNPKTERVEIGYDFRKKEG